jgi:hypothetical protein
MAIEPKRSLTQQDSHHSQKNLIEVDSRGKI